MTKEIAVRGEHYIGSPCRRESTHVLPAGGTVRYVGSCHCVACSQERARERQRSQRGTQGVAIYRVEVQE